MQETNAFTRFSSPVPTQFTHTSILGQPPTQARGVHKQGEPGGPGSEAWKLPVWRR
jgi:hypothetical protein